MKKGNKKNIRYTDEDTMPFEEIAKKLGISTSGAVLAYDRAMAKLRLRFSSPARREWLRTLLAELPEHHGHTFGAQRKTIPSKLKLRNFPTLPKVYRGFNTTK